MTSVEKKIVEEYLGIKLHWWQKVSLFLQAKLTPEWYKRWKYRRM